MLDGELLKLRKVTLLYRIPALLNVERRTVQSPAVVEQAVNGDHEHDQHQESDEVHDRSAAEKAIQQRFPGDKIQRAFP